MIEPAWLYLKRVTIKKGALRTRVEAERVWWKAWEELEQWRIQAWIKRIPRHIKEVIRCEGGNNYIKGAANSTRNWKALKRMARYRCDVIAYMRQQVLLSLNRVNPVEPLISKPQEPELLERMKIGPQLPNQLLDLEPLYGDHDPKQRRQCRAKWVPHQPAQSKPTQSKPPSEKPSLKPLPPMEPPPPPQPREL